MNKQRRKSYGKKERHSGKERRLEENRRKSNDLNCKGPEHRSDYPFFCHWSFRRKRGNLYLQADI